MPADVLCLARVPDHGEQCQQVTPAMLMRNFFVSEPRTERRATSITRKDNVSEGDVVLLEEKAFGLVVRFWSRRTLWKR